MSQTFFKTQSIKVRSLFIGLLTLAAACTLYSSASLTVSAQGGTTFLTETFKNNINGWQPDGADNCTAEVSGGTLALTNGAPANICFATAATKIPDDSTVEVVVSNSGKTWNQGIILRADARDASSAFDQFTVDQTGHWYFTNRTDDGIIYQIAYDGQLQSFRATSPVTLKVDVKGDTFVYTINNQKVGTFKNRAFDHDPATPNYFGVLSLNEQTVASSVSKFSRVTVTVPRPTPTPVLGKAVLLKDTFQNNSNSWHIIGSDNCQAAVSDKALTISISNQADTCEAVPTSFKNAVSDQGFNIAVDVLNAGSDWSYGILMRSHTTNLTGGNGYLFLLTNAGEWYFISADNGKHSQLQTGNVSLTTVGQTMHLQATVQGSQFTFKVNDQTLGPFKDTSIMPEKGQSFFGLYTLTSSAPDSPVETKFTNLVVTGSKPSAPVNPGQGGATPRPQATAAPQGGQSGDQGGYGTVLVHNRIAVQLTVVFTGPQTQSIRVPALSDGAIQLPPGHYAVNASAENGSIEGGAFDIVAGQTYSYTVYGGN